MTGSDQDTLLMTRLHLFDIVLQMLPCVGCMAIGTDRKGVLIGAKTFSRLEIKLWTCRVDKIIIVNFLNLSVS